MLSLGAASRILGGLSGQSSDETINQQVRVQTIREPTVKLSNSPLLKSNFARISEVESLTLTGVAMIDLNLGPQVTEMLKCFICVSGTCCTVKLANYICLSSIPTHRNLEL